MDVHVQGFADGFVTQMTEGDQLGAGDVKKGPWTDEEDAVLINYVRAHGEGRWNSVAHLAGLKRTGKSCRLRWLNYLRPDVRRGNITLEEQLTILELHLRWGNRWSKIAKCLPGRTDNEIKNYWRTRVQKQAKQLKCDVNSKQFRDEMRHVWMPRMMERIRASSGRTPGQHPTPTTPQAVHDPDRKDCPTTHVQTVTEMSGATSTDSWDAQFSPRSDISECYKPISDVDLQTHLDPCHGIAAGFSDRTHVRGFDTDQSYDYMWSMDGGDESLLWDDLWNEENVGFLYNEGFL